MDSVETTARKIGETKPWEHPRAAPPLPASPAEAPTAMSVRFVDRSFDQCAFPIGDQRPGPDMMCCGAPIGGTVDRYCAVHRKRAFAPTKR